MKVYLYYTDTYKNIFEIYTEKGIKEVKENILLPEAHKLKDKIVKTFNANITDFTEKRKLLLEKEQELLKASRTFHKHSREYKENKKERKTLLKQIGHYNQLINTSKKRIEEVNFSNDEDLINWCLNFTRQRIEERYVLNYA